MLLWTWRSLWSEPGTLMASLAATAMALLLAISMRGVFAGESDQLVRYLVEGQADVWVMQQGVRNMHMASSLLPEAKVAEIEAVPGVRAAAPILYLNGLVEAGDSQLFAYVVGLPEHPIGGGPWELSAGEAVPGPGELVLPAAAARSEGLKVGDDAVVGGRTLRISGLSEGTRSLTNTVVFVSMQDLRELMFASSAVSYVLVYAEPPLTQEALASRVREQVQGVEVLTAQDFIEADRKVAEHMGVDLVKLMSWVGSALAALVIALTVFASTARRSREYAITLAIGATRRQLYLAVAAQTAVTALLGFALAATLAVASEPLLRVFVPEVAVDFITADLLRLLLLSLLASLPAAALPAYRVARLDPVQAFSN